MMASAFSRTLAILLAVSTCPDTASTSAGRCEDVTAEQLVELSSTERERLLRSCDADARARLLFEHARRTPVYTDEVFDALDSRDSVLGPALIARAARTAPGADHDFLLLLDILSVLHDPRLPEARSDRKELLEPALERARAIPDPRLRRLALFRVDDIIGPPDEPVPGQAERDAFAESFMKSWIDDASGLCEDIGYEISIRPGHEEQDGGTIHEYVVRLQTSSQRTLRVHQVAGRVVHATFEPSDCIAIP